MLLEFKVWSSREWYEQALPMLQELGLRDKTELSWSDPDTDGELSGWYFDFEEAGASLDPAQLADVLARVRRAVVNGEAPQIEISFVPSAVRK